MVRRFVRISITPSGVIEQLSSDPAGLLHIGVPITGLTVNNLQGFAVSNTTPANNEVLTWNGSAWIPRIVSSSATTLGGYPVTTSAPVSGNALFWNGSTWKSDYVVPNNIQGFSVTSSAPTSGNVLFWNGTTWNPESFVISVTNLQGYSVTASAPVSGNVLTWNGSVWTNEPVVATVDNIQGYSVTASAPVSGNALFWNGSTWISDNVVPNNIQGFSVTASTPSSGSALIWNGSVWTHEPVVVTVDNLQGYSVTASAPVSGNALFWNGSVWVSNDVIPNNLQGYSVTASAPVSGNALFWNGSVWVSDNVVPNNIQGFSVTASTPTSGNALFWNGSTWVSDGVVPNNLQGFAVTASTPVSGNALFWNGSAWVSDAVVPNNIQGYPISGAAPASGEALVWNGSVWTPQTVASPGSVVSNITYYTTGYDTSNYYFGTVGTISGSATGFTSCVLVKTRAPIEEGAYQHIFGTFRQFVDGGWVIGYDSNRPTSQVTSGTTILSNGTAANNNDWLEVGYINGRFILFHLSYNGSSELVRMYANGNMIWTANNIAFSPNPNQAPALGVESNSKSDPFFGGIVGAAYSSGSFFTLVDAVEHFNECANSGTLVNYSAKPFDNLWVVTSSTAPPTLVDQIGNINLFLTGALTIASTSNPIWL